MDARRDGDERDGTNAAAPAASAPTTPAANTPAGHGTSERYPFSRGEARDADGRARGGPAPGGAPAAHRTGGFRSLTPEGADHMTPPPPPASARFPDARPAPGGDATAPAARPGPASRAESPAETTTRLRRVPAPPARPPAPAPYETPAETTTRLRRVPGYDDGHVHGSRPAAPPVGPPPAPPAAGQPSRGLGERLRTRTAAAVACLVLGLGLIGGAATGSLLAGGPDGQDAGDTYAAAAELWHSVPVDRLFPPTVAGRGAGPGGADRTWTRVAVAPDSGCAGAFDPLLRKALAPVGCRRLLRATYTDATQSYVTTVGLLFTEADAKGMTALRTRFTDGGLDRRADLMPRPFAARGTAAAGFGTAQRASWTVSVLTDAPVVLYAVSGWADGRTVDPPQPAADAVRAGATTAVAQAGLGFEAQGLADRVGRALRARIATDREKTS
ncbi:hypothetical protein [Streptomyces sp. NPDC008150]|uniref:hypothetical protein n=1 Tax=Streptomyces sp. NPDC008150 TaxID=3364816 RepID=UPI0036E4D458